MFISNWKMDFGRYKALDCTVPCDMYSTLEAHGYINDPYYATNEESLVELSRENAVFYTEFSLDDDALSREKIELIFYGLDTICDIYFNGSLLGSVKNMHRRYEFDIKALARAKNELRLFFKSPLEYFERKEGEHHLYMNCDSLPGASHLRKAFYMSGWDWAPMLPNMGIFREVELLAYDVDKIDDVLIVQNHRDGCVSLDIEVNTKHSADALSFVCEIDGQSVELPNGKGKVTIENPRLWWPRGYGEQNLYDITFYIYKKNRLIDKSLKTIGLRTLHLSQEPDGEGSEFCFAVNGVKIFAMGANHVPVDSLPARFTNERLERLIKDCLFANFNCIRVWGGAFYPCDYFYDLCDKYGLIVWQDFMVACANVRLTSDFENEFIEEAVYNIKRIRHHASLGILCGNNEMEEAICFWECADGHDALVRSDYLRLYEDILPALCKKHAPFISYTPSSPTSGGGFNNPQDYTRGDVHFWNVWNGNCELSEYRKYKFRFCSEYGFESLPCIKTIESFCPRDERNLLSYTMEAHQKHACGNVKLLRYLAEAYQMPKDLRATVYASQLNQALAIKYGVEHFRRCRGYTMGSIYWQLNDCWPVASWSSIDYFGRYKALHYFARSFYQPVALGLFNEGDKIHINVANETMNDFSGYFKAGVYKSDFTEICSFTGQACVTSLSSLDVASFDNKDFNGIRDAYFFAELYDENGNLIARSVELGAKPKHFKFIKPKIEIKVGSDARGVYLELCSKALVKNLEVSFKNYDIVLSDNYFDLVNSEPYRVYANTALTEDEIAREVCLFSVYDISK